MTGEVTTTDRRAVDRELFRVGALLLREDTAQRVREDAAQWGRPADGASGDEPERSDRELVAEATAS